MGKEKEAFDFCLKEMFLRVGEKYPNKELTDQQDWYKKRSWTEEDLEGFRKWMVAYLRKKMRWSKHQCETEASMFILQWSWTTFRPLAIKGIRK